MKKRNFLWILIVCVVCISFMNSMYRNRNEGTFLSPNNAEDHPIIYIDGNSQLSAFLNKTGSGSDIDPYVIQDLEIDAEWATDAASI